MKDPLATLREDTFTNEETNEMVGRMIREDCKKTRVEKEESDLEPLPDEYYEHLANL